MSGITGKTYNLITSNPATIGINGGTGTDAKTLIPAHTLVRCVCTTSTSWIATKYSSNGDESAVAAAF